MGYVAMSLLAFGESKNRTSFDWGMNGGLKITCGNNSNNIFLKGQSLRQVHFTDFTNYASEIKIRARVEVSKTPRGKLRDRLCFSVLEFHRKHNAFWVIIPSLPINFDKFSDEFRFKPIFLGHQSAMKTRSVILANNASRARTHEKAFTCPNMLTK